MKQRSSHGRSTSILQGYLKKTSDDRQRKVLEIAVKEFAEKGYHNVSVNVITQEAGLMVNDVHPMQNYTKSVSK